MTKQAEAASASLRARWRDPKRRAAMQQQILEGWTTEVRQRIGAKMRALWRNPEFRARTVAGLRRAARRRRAKQD